MGARQSKEVPVPPEGTPTYSMYLRYSPKSCRHLDKWNFWTRQDSSKHFPVEGTFNLDKIVHLRGALESRGPKVPQGQWAATVGWYKEASKRKTESQARCLRGSQEKWKDQGKHL